MILNESNIVARLYIESVVEKYHYVGNCSDSFDPDTGDCLSNIFSDVSEFANYDEKATCEDIENSDGCGKIDAGEFLSLVDSREIPNDIRRIDNLEYHYYDNETLAIYDQNNDIHYFFSK